MALVRLTIILFLTLLPLISGATLTPEILSKINSQKMYVSSQEIIGAPWPKYTIATKLDIPVKEAIAIFSAYHHQKKYVPGVLSSTPVKHISPTDIHVAFEMYMPWPLSNTFYTTGNILKKTDSGNYQVQWYYVKSDSTKENKGSATFIRYKGKTILLYDSFIHPDSSFASLVSGKVKGDLIKTIVAIKAHLEKTYLNNSAAVAIYLTQLDQTFSGVLVYQKMILANQNK